MTNKPQFVGERVKLGDCFPYIKNGYNVRQGKDKGGIPITRIETLSDNQFNRDKVGYADIFSTEGLENRILEDGDILMSHINSLPYLGRSVMYRARPCEVIIHGMNLLRLKADRSIVEPEYAELYFRSPHFKQQVLTIAKKAVNQASFSVNNLKELEFPLMSLCGQRDAIEKLSSISAQIEYCQRVIGMLDQLVKSRFVEMFGDVCEGTSYYDMAPINNLCTRIVGGGTPSMKHPEYYEGGTIPWLKSGDVKARVVESGILNITEEGLVNSSARMVPEGSIIVVTRSGILKHTLPVAKAACPVAINQDLKALILGDRILPDFLQWSLIVASPLLLSKVRATTADNIETSFLKSFRVPVPPAFLQRKFVKLVAQVDKSRFVAQQQIEKLQMLYDSLAQEYFGD